MKAYDLYRRSLVAIFVFTTQFPISAVAEDVILNPGYITGQAAVGTPGQKVRTLSMSAYGGGYSSSKGVSQDYREPVIPLEYSFTVQGGDWETTVNATATSSPVGSYYPYTNIYFSPRTLAVPATEPPTTVENNNYTTDASVRFQLSFTSTSDPYTHWYAYAYARKEITAGGERTYSRSYARNSWCNDPDNCSWEMPVVANSADPEDPNDQGVRIYAYVRVGGTHPDGTGYNQYYYFWWNYPDYRYEDIAPGDTLVIPLAITHKAPDPQDPQEYGTGTVQGTVNLGLTVEGVDYGDMFNYPVWPYSYHYVTGQRSGAVYSNPGDYLIENVREGTWTYRAYSYLADRLSDQDPWRSLYLRWPYTAGDSINDQVTVLPGQVSQKDFSDASGILTGKLQLTGTLRDEDLDWYQLRAYGACDYYVNGAWERQPTCGGYSYDTVYGTDADQSYRLFLTPGPWNAYYLRARATDTDALGYYSSSYMLVYDYAYQFDGNYYDFGQPTHIDAGLSTVQNRHYKTGGVSVCFQGAGGDRLSSPSVSGWARRYNQDNKQEMYVSLSGNANPPATVEVPEVLLHGPEGDYTLTPRAVTADGSNITFPARQVALDKNVFKLRCLAAPDIVIDEYIAETNDMAVEVSGSASDSDGIQEVVYSLGGEVQHREIYNQVAQVPLAQTDVTSGLLPTEVTFSYEFQLTAGTNILRVTVVDGLGNESYDEWEVFVNSPPAAKNNAYTTDEDTALSGNVLTDNTGDGVDSDPDGHSLTVDIVPLTGPTNGTLVLNADGSFTYTPNLDFDESDTFIYRVSDGHDATATASVTITVTPVNDPPVVTSGTLNAQSVQYGDRIAPVTLTAEDVDSGTLTLTAPDLLGDVKRPDESTPEGCQPSGKGAICTWTRDGQVLVGTDASPYTVVFQVDDGNGGSAESSMELTVTAEDAGAAFAASNPTAVHVANNQPFSLTVQVYELDESLGDLSKAVVSMSLVPVGPGGEAVGECLPTATDGNVTCDFDGVSVETYSVEVSISGDYYTGSAEDVLTVYDPSLGFTTGGGWFNWPGTGEKTNFGYTMKYGKKGTNVRGSLLLIRHLDGGTKYRIKSNALDALAIGQDPTVPYGWASFSGKATYLEPGMLEPEGNHGFTVYVEDRDEPGSGNDRFWITARAKDGSTIPVMSLPESAPGNAEALKGGNIVAPH